MNEQYNEQTSISLNRLLVMFLHGLKKLWLLVLVLAVLGGAAMGAWSWYRYTPSYTASVTFTVYVKNDAQAEIPAYNQAAANQMAETFPRCFERSCHGGSRHFKPAEHQRLRH